MFIHCLLVRNSVGILEAEIRSHVHAAVAVARRNSPRWSLTWPINFCSLLYFETLKWVCEANEQWGYSSKELHITCGRRCTSLSSLPPKACPRSICVFSEIMQWFQATKKRDFWGGVVPSGRAPPTSSIFASLGPLVAPPFGALTHTPRFVLPVVDFMQCK